MARTVFFHVGLPKTGTTYLQSLLWDNREELARQGVLLPGASSREHLWASAAVREDPRLRLRSPEAPGAWERLVEEVNAWPGTALVTHEFFAAASAEQAARAIAALGDADVHVVATARDTVSLVTARWQEFVKNGSVVPIDGYPRREETDPADEWDWGTLDLADVLARWGATLPPGQVHVLPLPGAEEPRETLWLRFAALVGIDASRCTSAAPVRNESLGVVEVQLLRRVNAELRGFRSATDRGVWIRGYLAEGKLVPRGGERFWPSQARVAELRARGERIADEVERAGYHVVGDGSVLRPPPDVPDRRHPEDVTDGEMLQAAAATIAAMLGDVRSLTQDNRRLRSAASSDGLSGWRRWVPDGVRAGGRRLEPVRRLWVRPQRGGRGIGDTRE